MTTKGTDNRFRSLTVVGESGTPSTPGTGDFKLYVADDGTFYLMDDTGTPTAIGGGGFSDPMTTRGDIIVRNASNVTARLAIGSAGKVLSSDGTDVSWQTPSGGAGSMVWLQRQSAANSTTVNFQSFVSSTYEAYVFHFYDVKPVTDNVALYARVGTGGTPTYDSGANYAYASFRNSPSGSALAGSGSTNQWGIDGGGGIDNAADSAVAGIFTLYAPSTTPARRVMWQVGYVDNASSPISCFASGVYNPAGDTAITAVQFLMSSGNVDTGVFDLYGLTHA